MTSLHSEIRDHLMTRDQGTTHKLKPRLFIKSYSALTSFTCHQSLLLEFILSLSNITPLRSILLSITLHLHPLKFRPWQNLQTHTSSCHVLALMSCQSAAPSFRSNSIPLANQTISCFTSGLPRRSRYLQSGTSHTPVRSCSSPPPVEPLEFHSVNPITIPLSESQTPCRN